MNALITGGCGYIGAWLIPHLLADGHKVTVLDAQHFGDGSLSKDNDSLKVVKGDVCDPIQYSLCAGQEAVIYLASISSNEMCEKHPKAAKAVNGLSPVSWALSARLHGIKRFIYAASVAAYGSSDKDANEEAPLAPTTGYAKGKAAAESGILQSTVFPGATIVRSASVCGFSQRQRFDLTVNKMVYDAMMKGVVTVNGGEQKRSHVHIKDISDFYKLLLKAPLKKIAGEVFNVVAENQTVLETSQLVAAALKAKLEIKPRSDNRSYSVDGTKAREILGFTPKKRVADAVRDLKIGFDSGYWQDSETNDAYWNVVHGLS